MRLLMVGLSGSAHLARYADVLVGQGWDLHLFEPHQHSAPHPDLPAMTLHLPRAWQAPAGSPVRVAPIPEGAGTGYAGRASHLAAVIRELQPDVIHSHETLLSGGLVDGARRRLGELGAPWLLTNWGSDLFWEGRDPRNTARLRSVVGSCDYYGAECHRDVALARAFGLRGRIVGVWPVAGGSDIARVSALRNPGPTSARRTIAIKGIDSIYGQARVGLAALARCGDLVTGWELAGYQMQDASDALARSVAESTGMRYTVLSAHDVRQSSHDDLLAMHGRSRVSLGLNRSDGLSTSFLEALTMGSFPVQGHGSCGYELTPDGRGALFVDPRDPDQVEAALRRALTDDELVDRAAEHNYRVAAEHLDRGRVGARIVDMYERILDDVALGVG